MLVIRPPGYQKLKRQVPRRHRRGGPPHDGQDDSGHLVPVGPILGAAGWSAAGWPRRWPLPSPGPGRAPKAQHPADVRQGLRGPIEIAAELPEADIASEMAGFGIVLRHRRCDRRGTKLSGEEDDRLVLVRGPRLLGETAFRRHAQ